MSLFTSGFRRCLREHVPVLSYLICHHVGNRFLFSFCATNFSLSIVSSHPLAICRGLRNILIQLLFVFLKTFDKKSPEFVCSDLSRFIRKHSSVTVFLGATRNSRKRAERYVILFVELWKKAGARSI